MRFALFFLLVSVQLVFSAPQHAALLLRRSTASAPAFNPFTDITWDSVWMAGSNTFNTGSTPATDGQTVENWGDAIGNTKTLTQATSGKRPTYRASDALFNSKGCLEGERAAARAMQWTRSSDLTPPYTVIVIGVMPAKTTAYQSFAGNANGILNMWPWDNYNSPNSSESIYLQGANREGNARTTNATLWHVGVSSTTTMHRVGRNGLNSVPASFTGQNFGGFSLWRYPTSDALHGSGKIAFIGVASSMLTSNANWTAFLNWASTFYGIPMVNRATVICDGDSRTRGYTYLDDGNHLDKMWMHLVESRMTNPTAVMNIGVSGRTMQTQITDAATRLTPLVAEMVSTNKIVVCINAGYNDLAGGATAATAYQRVCDYVRDRHEEGFLVLLGTAPTATGIGFEAARLTLNASILANAGDGGGGASSIADGVVDIADDADTTSANPFAFADPTTPHTPANFNADKTHWSTAGNAIIADLVEAALNAAPFNLH